MSYYLQILCYLRPKFICVFLFKLIIVVYGSFRLKELSIPRLFLTPFSSDKWTAENWESKRTAAVQQNIASNYLIFCVNRSDYEENKI